MKPTILEAIHHLSEHYGLTLAEAQALVRTPLHPAGLRDDLAGRAMQGTLSSGRNNIDLAAKRYAKDISESAYALADAMLKAREE